MEWKIRIIICLLLLLIISKTYKLLLEIKFLIKDIFTKYKKYQTENFLTYRAIEDLLIDLKNK